jgi:hypothetical protein
MKKLAEKIFRPYRLELLLWSGLLLAPIFINPLENHVSFCLFHNLGFDFCPGCGLGRSLAFLYRGDLTRSFLCHPLGMIAFCILLFRIIQLSIKLSKNSNYLTGRN